MGFNTNSMTDTNLQNQIDELIRIKTDVEMQLKERESHFNREMQQMERKMEQLGQDNATLSERNEQLDDENGRLREAMKEAIQNANNTFMQMQGDIEQKEQGMKQDRDALVLDKQTLEAENAHLAGQIEKLTLENTQCLEESQTLKETVETLEQENMEMRVALGDRVSPEQSQEQETDNETEKLKMRISQLTEVLKEMKDKLSSNAGKLSLLKNEYRKLKEESENSSAKAKVEMETMERAAKLQRENMESLQTQHNELQQECLEVKNQVAQLSMDLSNARKASQVLAEDRNTLRDKLNSCSKDLETQEGKNADLEKYNSDLERAVADITHKMNVLLRKNYEMEESLNQGSGATIMKELFDVDEHVIDTFACGLATSIVPYHGRIYVTPSHIAFHSKLIPGISSEFTQLVKMSEIVNIEKAGMGFGLMPNAIRVKTEGGEELWFCWFVYRDDAFTLIHKLWEKAIVLPIEEEEMHQEEQQTENEPQSSSDMEQPEEPLEIEPSDDDGKEPDEIILTHADDQLGQGVNVHTLFDLNVEERVLHVFPCLLHRLVVIPGSVYVLEKRVCFVSDSIAGTLTLDTISFEELKSVSKRNTALFFGNAIEIESEDKSIFVSLDDRESLLSMIEEARKADDGDE